MRPSLLATSLLLSLPAWSAELHGLARAWVGPGLDTNAKRDFVSPGVSTDVDGFVFALGQLEGTVAFERVRLAGSYDVAARKFFTYASEDTVVQNAQLEGSLSLGKAFAAGLSGRARDRRGAGRDYSELVGAAAIEFLPDGAVEVRLLVGAHRFIYWPRFSYSFSGPDGTLQARYRFNRRHSAALFANANLRTYNALTNPNPNDTDLSPKVTRFDTAVQAGLSYSYRGPFHFTASYSYFDQSSNSFGETLRRHRLSLTGAFRLPWQLMIFASAALQLSQFPDGVYLSPELQVLDDDENSSSVTVKVVRPLTPYLDLDLRYALYVNALPQSNYLYLRQVASLGVSVSF